MIKQLLMNYRAARTRRKLNEAMRIIAANGMYVCYIKVVAGTHYLCRPDGMMYKVGKPISGVRNEK